MKMFPARTRKQGNSIVITIPNELELENDEIYQFWVDYIYVKKEA